MLVLSLAALEIGFGIGGRVFERLGLSETSLLPANEWSDMRFTWHPLLQAVPIPTPLGELHPHIRHNSRKLRGQERTPELLAGKKVVALFGGSSTYDQGNGDGDSWPERLEALLGLVALCLHQPWHGRLRFGRTCHSDGILRAGLRPRARLRDLLHGLERRAQRAHFQPRSRLCRLPPARAGRWRGGAAHRRTGLFDIADTVLPDAPRRACLRYCPPADLAEGAHAIKPRPALEAIYSPTSPTFPPSIASAGSASSGSDSCSTSSGSLLSRRRRHACRSCIHAISERWSEQLNDVMLR